ncbi:uncharacterized protein Dmoj_GI16141, isoform B [Drosophila mojavensis]|uniref:Uncharacterized protein, isoform B n=2 Tax=Drosophila mojavensis TaxID=7230 RepID=B4L6P5_DROMO|nr:uncharacterized protein Dmoj_GI16141, isoform C [Drosophila mojavensis]KRG07133.1 uncharacterized protein Dmoj_GI16141, isoform B [Drosophila mojavensis]
MHKHIQAHTHASREKKESQRAEAMNPPRPRLLYMRQHRLQPALHWGPNEEQHHDYDRFIPPLVAARLQHENPMDVARFVQNLRIILQRQRVHFDMGEGDGIHVWSWRLPPRAIDQDGGGDDIRLRRRLQAQMLPVVHRLPEAD